MSSGARNAHGAALILVLWLLVLLTAVIGGFAQSARIEALQAHQMRASLIARQAAQAGIEYGVWRMAIADERRRWVPDGRKYDVSFGDARLDIRVLDESGKVDLNSAPLGLLVRLLHAIGVREPRAHGLAAAIVDYRDPDDLLSPDGAESRDYRAARLPYGPKNKPFESVSEVQRVLGMDFATYQKLEPVVTVYTGGEPSPSFAPAAVLEALGLSPDSADLFRTQREAWRPGAPGPPPALPNGQPFVVQPGTGTYAISSHVLLHDGTSLTVNAIVRASQSGPLGQLYVPLQWREGESY